jgi:hypothetical protein
MSRRYRMTPRRKAALKKAQAASARKRKRASNKRIAVGAGIAGGVLGVAVAGYATHSYIKKLGQGGPQKPKATGKELDLIRLAPISSGSNWPNVGRPLMRTTVTKQRRRKKLPNYIESEKARVKHIQSLDRKALNARRRYHNRRRAGLPGRRPKS